MSSALRRGLSPRGVSALLRVARGSPAGPARLASSGSSDVFYRPIPWTYAWKPGPYPATKEAREAAAKKYNMIPEDYKPFPPDHEPAMGDYPDLAPSSGDSRSGHIWWDIDNDKRNFGEPLPYYANMTSETGYDDTGKFKYGYGEMTFNFLMYCGTFVVLLVLAAQVPFYQPFAEKQLPYDNPDRKFYSFELKKD